MEVVIGIVFSVIFFLFFLQNKAGPADAGERAAQAATPPAMDLALGQTERGKASRPSDSAPGLSMATRLPEDSVLRRHYVTHVRQMVEDMAGPVPGDSVLRRHHEQLVGSRVDECLENAEQLAALFEQFGAFRRAT
ncbi:hypothetical protein [Methyloterricola oryzae]|uniref:hypothetical protein n=1 Tax=Methyloterricola oryzae TaxID=1495050 RepID=UPI000699E01F|nr:hypothetical protein [Methyloterricola oryzae]